LTLVELLVNDEATFQQVREALFEFTRQAAEQDLVLLYFSGHGVPDPGHVDKLYLVCYDSDPNHIPSTALPMDDLQAALKDVRAQRVVVLADACHSAGIAAEGKRGIGVNRVNRSFLDLFETKPSAAIFTSSEGYELSNEGARWGEGHGVFTWAFLQALQGQADGYPGSDADGVVTLGEAIEFTRATVLQETGNGQHPAIRGTFDRALPMSTVTSGYRAP
jgi:uncharacterized caspase-like protein